MAAPSIDEVAEAMYALVRECHGKRNLKATDLTKAMLERFGEAGCDRQLCKQAIRSLVDDGRCTYSYFGASFIVLAPDAVVADAPHAATLLASAQPRPQGTSPAAAVSTAGRVSSARPRQIEKQPPCTGACPAGNDVRGALAHLAQHEKTRTSWDDACASAWRLLVDTNPFPAVMGRICPHLCEGACTRAAKDGAVSMGAIERYLGDLAIQRNLPLPLREPAQQAARIAVIGAGPSGLTAASELARRGHAVTVFERRAEAGGMLRYGIPAHRLPRAVLAAEVRRILDLGVELRCNVNATLAAIRGDFAAVLVAIGAQESRGMAGVCGPRVWPGIDFLRHVAEGGQPAIGHQIVVVGGGNTAIDAARTAVRLARGATVTLLRQENDQLSSELADAIDEGVRVEWLATVGGLHREAGGELREVTARRVTLGERDASGFPALLPVSGGDFALAADTLILAMGQDPDLAGAGLGAPLTVDARGRTAMPRVWASGDAVHVGLAVAAIARGRAAALAIEAQLARAATDEDGSGAGAGVPASGAPLAPGRVKLELFENRSPVVHARTAVAERLAAADLEVELGISTAEAGTEASRCMACGHCSGCERCWMFCTPGSVVKLAVAQPGRFYRLDHATCTGCRKCAEECPSAFLEMA